jgi:hypothetical protein
MIPQRRGKLAPYSEQLMLGGKRMNVEVSQEVGKKKNYHTPELIELGSIPTIVQNTTGGGNDANQTPNSGSMS